MGQFSEQCIHVLWIKCEYEVHVQLFIIYSIILGREIGLRQFLGIALRLGQAMGAKRYAARTG